MKVFRLINDTFNCHEAFIDFKAMHRQFNDVKVWLSLRTATFAIKNSTFFVNAKNQLTVHVFWFWWLRRHGHVAVRSSPATYQECRSA